MSCSFKQNQPVNERNEKASVHFMSVVNCIRISCLRGWIVSSSYFFLSTDSFHVSHTFQKIFQNQISLKVRTVSQIKYRRTVRIRNVRAKRHSINAPTVPFKLYQHTYQLSRDQTKATRQGRFVSASLGFEMILSLKAVLG